MEVQQTYGDQVRFIGVPGLADVESMERFVTDTGTDDFPQIPDPDSVLWNQFGIRVQRTYVYIDDSGEVRVSGYGNLAGDVEELIAS